MELTFSKAQAILNGLESSADEGIMPLESFQVACEIIQAFPALTIPSLLTTFWKREQEHPGAFVKWGARYYVAEEWCGCQQRKPIAEVMCAECRH